MSDTERTQYKARKTAEIRNHNAEFIKDLGISIYDFNMKTPFIDQQKRLVVGIFSSEFRKPKGFFFELIDSDLNPTDPDRKIYRVPPSDSFEEEYELNSKGSYLVPLEELKVVHPQSIAISKMNAFTPSPSEENLFKPTMKAQLEKTSIGLQAEAVIPKAPAPMEDAPYSDMTIRDYYAIQTGKAVSCKAWLNELIKSK
jgi:hypothetical protein